MEEKPKRDEYEIREDYHSVKRALEVFKNKERFNDVKEMIKSKQEARESLDAIGDGDLKTALGL
jgi:hypothetical protein